MRKLYHRDNNHFLISYAVIFLLAFLSDPDYLSVAFDSGGVTTGPMTSPFIMSLGIGVAAIRADKKAESDSFGLLALCSVGPILSVLILGFFYGGESSLSASFLIHNYDTSTQLAYGYVSHLPEYLAEVAIALAPVVGFFAIFQLIALRLHKVSLLRIVIGLVFTYAGLVLFLTGVNVGFSNLGAILGGNLASGMFKYILIPVGALLGWFIVSAEPAVHILTKQVEEISAGATGGTVLHGKGIGKTNAKHFLGVSLANEKTEKSVFLTTATSDSACQEGLQ